MDEPRPQSPLDVRRKIVLDYARWTALSALRSGAPVKSRSVVYSLLDAVAFDDILASDAPADDGAFDRWHEAETRALCGRNAAVPVGWAVKLINVYLKTAAYVGGLGRPGLLAVLHPPIDEGLKRGLRTQCRQLHATNSGFRPVARDVIRDVCCVRRIKDIIDYSTYRRIIGGCKRVAEAVGCSLIEVEQFWLGADTPALKHRGADRPAGESDA